MHLWGHGCKVQRLENQAREMTQTFRAQKEIKDLEADEQVNYVAE